MAKLKMTNSIYRIQGATGEWEVVIGLEVHAQVTSNAKLFSGAATAFGAEPNTQVSLIDAAMPGMLPVPNRECIRQAVRTGLAIDAQINRWSRFDRKNYFYADLPQGYQISQHDEPLCEHGAIDVWIAGARHAVALAPSMALSAIAASPVFDAAGFACTTWIVPGFLMNELRPQTSPGFNATGSTLAPAAVASSEPPNP